MPKITFITHAGQTHFVEARIGDSLMQAATSNMVPGVLADCGGNLACATCHVYLDDTWGGRVAEQSDDEKGLMEFALGVRPGESRLSCQIEITAEHDGLVVHLPESQI